MGIRSEALERRCLLSATLVHAGADISSPAVVGKTLFFLDRGSNEDTVLWKTDGSAAGTAIVKDFSGTKGGTIRPESMTSVGTRLFFVMKSRVDKTLQLWRSDGTSAGTREVFSTGDLGTEDISKITPVGDKLFFVSRLRGHYGSVFDYVFCADATQVKATRVAPGVFGDPVLTGNGIFLDTYVTSVASYRGSFCLGVVSGGGYSGKIYETDGTDAGTQSIWAFDFEPYGMTGVGDTLLFVSSWESEIWESKGLAGSTHKLDDGVTQDFRVDESFLFALNGHALFEERGSQQLRSLAVDTDDISTIEGATLAEVRDGIVRDGIAYYVHNGGSLWRTDGSVAGTIEQNANLGNGRYYGVSVIGINGSSFYFQATDSNVGNSVLLMADGPAKTPRLVQVPSPARESNLILLNKKPYYFSEDDSGIRLFQLHPGVGDVSGKVTLDSAAGEFPLAGYRVYFDSNHNGNFDASEPSSITSSKGRYLFSEIPPGQITVRIEKLAANQEMTTPTAQTVALAPDGSETVDFGFATDPRPEVVAGSVSGKVTLYSGIGNFPLSGYRVFIDSNHNGTQEPGEPSTTTKSNGRYSFSGVAPGDVSVVVKTLAHQLLTTARVRKFTLAPRGSAAANFGIANDPRPASIAGTVFDDGDGDGNLDANEARTAGATVFIDSNTNGVLDDDETRVQTAEDGSYEFDGLKFGSYRISFIAPPKTTGHSYYNSTIALPGRAIVGPDLGFTHNSTVRGQLFSDINGNGVRDGVEPALGGVRVRLQFVNYDVEYVSVYFQASTRTHSVGRYEISVPSGSVLGDLRIAPDIELDRQRYSVGIAGQMETSHSTGAICACINFGGGSYSPPRIAQDETIVRDYGVTDKVLVQGKLFRDDDASGALSYDDLGISGRLIYIDLNDNGIREREDPYTYTDADGKYSFGSLAAGSYVVRVTVPKSAWRATTPTAQELAIRPGESKTVNFGNQHV